MKTIMIVDGYNVIHNSEDLKRLSNIELEEAREKLIEDLIGYSSFKGFETTVVFDAYRQETYEKKVEVRGNVTIVFTAKNKTADAYIEKQVFGLPNAYRVLVVTSDYTLQRMVLANGGERVPARELLEDIEVTQKRFRIEKEKQPLRPGVALTDFMDEDTLEKFKLMRIKDE
ncbi:MAG: NYN domain-containing protein [Eubacteriaceae bacterium]